MRILPKLPALFVTFISFLIVSSPVQAATTNVSITSTGFIPESITINVGDTVVWTNNDTTDHTATDDELTWDTDLIAPSGTGSQIFNTAGTFTYSDTIDPTLTGSIIVQASSTTGTTTTPTPSTTTTTTTTTSPTPIPQPVSGVSGPTTIIMTLGGLLLLAGIYAFRFA